MSKFHHFGIAGVARIGITLVLVLCAALLSVQMVFADQGPDEDSPVVQPAGKLCVKGTVISHDEKPLTDGWTITATEATLQQTQVITSDKNGAFVFDPLTVGIWHFAITVKPNYELITPGEFDVPVDYAADCWPIRFKLRRIVEVTVIKIDDEHNPWPGWTICAEPAPDNFFATRICLVTDKAGKVLFRLTPGNWNFVESPPAGVPLLPVMPPSDRQSLNVQPPGPYTLRFKNLSPIHTGCIEVFKYDTPPVDEDDSPEADGADVPQASLVSFPLPGWHIDVLRADGSVAASGVTDAFGRVIFCRLPLGPYTVAEEIRKAWKPTTDSRFLVTVVEDETATVTFYNKQDRGFCFEGRKIDANGNVGLPGWITTATPVAAGGYQPEPAVTDGLGYYRICLPEDDYRVRGASYKICEVMQDGWLSHTATCYGATLPQYPDAPVLIPDFVNQQVGHWESVGGGTTPSKPGCRSNHTVKRGEYLGGIAVQYSVSLYDLMKANPWVYGRYQYYILVGEILCIP